METVIALLGPPGSGKGTQAERLRDELGFTWLSTGALLRAECAEGTELGRQAGGYMDRGELVPDEVITEMVEHALDEVGGGPVLLDGFPRSVAQAEALGRALDRAILVDIPDAVAVERILGRARGPERVRRTEL